MGGTKSKSVVADPHRVVWDNKRPVYGVSCAADARVIATSFPAHGPAGEQVSLLSQEGKRLGGFGTGTGCICWYAEMSPDGGTVAAGFGDCTLRLWDVATDKTRTLGTLGGIVASLKWSKDGKRLFTGNCGDNTVRLWDIASGTVIAQGKTKKSATMFVALAPDAKRAVSGAGDKLIHVWQPAKGEEVGTLAGHTGKILGLRFSPDGRRLASASQDRTVRLWDVAKSAEIAVLEGHRKQVSCVAFFPAGDAVASTSSDGTIRVWTMKGKEVRAISPGATAQSIAITADGSELIAGCDDGVVLGFAM